MSETLAKTLQATLATPTTGKEQRLQRFLDTDRHALHDAFDGGTNTMAAVNDIVTQESGHFTHHRALFR